jgi:CRISPR/Cas system CSM-associated protein Csm2 small subunit
MVADSKMKRKYKEQNDRASKAAIESEKNAAMAELKLKFLLCLEYCRKIIEEELSNKESQTSREMLGDVKLN